VYNNDYQNLQNDVSLIKFDLSGKR